MNSLISSGAQPKTMSSLEIAELTGKRHGHVLRDIRNMLSELGATLSQFWEKVPSDGGRPLDVAKLPRRECLILVSGYSVELRARIIDRWEELESASGQHAPARLHAGREARMQFKLGLSIARMLGLVGNQAVLSANGLARRNTGVDVLEAMGQRALIAPQQTQLINATVVGRLLDGRSAISVNALLSDHGLQVGATDNKGRSYWEPTEKGLAAGGVMVDRERSNKTGTARQLLWSTSIVDTLQQILEAA